jgi:predicted MFS family arabinose efflux permease
MLHDSLLLTSPSFQEVQGHSATETSLRILPALITAVLSNVAVGYFVNRISVTWVVLVSAVLTAASPLLMALINPEYPYWYMAFTAQVSEARRAIQTDIPCLGNDPPTRTGYLVTSR